METTEPEADISSPSGENCSHERVVEGLAGTDNNLRVDDAARNEAGAGDDNAKIQNIDTDDHNEQIEPKSGGDSPGRPRSALNEDKKDDDYWDDRGEHTARKSARYSSDMIEGTNSKSHVASMRQMIDRTFFDSMLMEKRIILRSDDPLHVAIASTDSIGVQMILEELGKTAPLSVAKRDADGRTAVHLAVMSGSESIVEHIIGAYRFFEGLQLQAELAALEKERDSSISKLKLGIQGARGTQDAFDKHRFTIDAWFRQEKARKIRQFEFRTEIWWAQMLCTKDLEGRTPLHCAVSRGASCHLVEALITRGRGEFFIEDGCVLPYELAGMPPEETKSMILASTNTATQLSSLSQTMSAVISKESKGVVGSSTMITRKSIGTGITDRAKERGTSNGKIKSKMVLRSQFLDNSMYEITSGREVAVFGRPTDTAKSPVFYSTYFNPDALMAGVAEPKNAISSSSSSSSSRRRVTDSTTATVPLRNVAWDLTQGRDIPPPMDRDGNRDHSYRPSVDYDIVVPWVLRNMLKSATDSGSLIGTGTGAGMSGTSVLEELFEAVENKHSGVLVVPELRVVLGELGIRVTVDVLREICRRYPAEMVDIQEKWKWLLIQQKEHQRRAAEEALRGSKEGGGGGDDDDAKGDAKNHADAKRGASAKRADNSPDRKGGDRDRPGPADEKGGSFSRFSRRKRPAQPDYAALVIEEEDENLGVNVRHLLRDITSGRGLQSMTLTKANNWDIKSYSSSNQPVTSLSDDLKELLQDGEHDELYRGSRNKFESSSRRSRIEDTILGMDMKQTKNESSVILPSCVTISTILKARKNVINLTDSFGRTALILASALGHGELMTTLLEHGADVAAITPEGYNAFTVAKNSKIRGLAERRLLSWLNKRHHVSDKYNKQELRHSTGDLDEIRQERERQRLIEEGRHDLDGESKQESKGGEGKFVDKDDALISSINKLRTEQAYLQGTLRGSMGELGGSQRASLLSTSMLFTEDRSKAITSLSMELSKLKEKNWSYSRPALTWAVHNGLLSSVRDMLKNRCDPSEPDVVGRTPLHECADLVKSPQIVHVEAAVSIAEALVDAGAQVNARTISGRTPLHEVFCKGQDESVSQCRISDGDRSMLYSTSSSNASVTTNDAREVSRHRRALVRSLLQLGADPLALDRHGMAPIHYCARENLTSCMVEILRTGASGMFPTSHQQTALHVACRAGASSVAHLLCRWDADSPMGKGIMDKKDKFGKTPSQLLSPSMSPRALDTLWAASRAGNLSRVSEILSKIKMSKQALWEEVDRTTAGIRDDALSLGLTSSYDRSPFLQDTASGSVQTKAGVGGEELWLLDGVDAKTRRLRWTALHACIVGWAEYQALTPTKETIARASKTSKNNPSLNLSARRALALPVASQAPSSSSVSFGSSQGTDTLASKERRSAVVTQKLNQPAQYRDTLLLLLQNHAFIDSLDANCRTPLMLAALCNLSEACSILLDGGADAGATDLNGNTALHLAYAFGSMSSALILEEKGADTNTTNASGRTASEEAGRFLHFCKIFDYPQKDSD